MPRIVKWMGDAMESLLASKMPLMEVIATQYISAAVKKIRFRGNLSGMHFEPGYAVVIRVNATDYRNYTPSFSDVEQGILEIIVHLHGNAPGALLMDRLQAGDTLRVSMPRGRKIYQKDIHQHVLTGDETTLGLAISLYPHLKNNGHSFHFYFELDEQNTTTPGLSGIDHYTVIPKGSAPVYGPLLQEILLHKATGPLACNFILAGNAASVQACRKALKQNNISGRNIQAQAYWMAGKTGL